jgi:hypothetical protein
MNNMTLYKRLRRLPATLILDISRYMHRTDPKSGPLESVESEEYIGIDVPCIESKCIIFVVSECIHGSSLVLES